MHGRSGPCSSGHQGFPYTRILVTSGTFWIPARFNWREECAVTAWVSTAGEASGRAGWGMLQEDQPRVIARCRSRICGGRTGRLDILYRLTDRLYRAADLEDVLSVAMDAITEGLGCEKCSILLFDAEGVMRFVAWRGLSDHYRKTLEGHTPWSRETADPPPLFIADIAATRRADHQEDDPGGQHPQPWLHSAHRPRPGNRQVHGLSPGGARLHERRRRLPSPSPASSASASSASARRNSAGFCWRSSITV